MEGLFAPVHVQVHHSLMLCQLSKRMENICKMGKQPKLKKSDTILLDMHVLDPELVEEWVFNSLRESII